MTQSTMRIHTAPAPVAAPKPTTKPVMKPVMKPQPKPTVATKPSPAPAATAAPAPASAKREEPQAQQRTADTPSDVIANAASETKRDKGVYASMKRAVSPYVEHHSHAVLYGILGFVAAALILIIGFWPTVLLAVFAAIGVLIGKYRDGDRATRQQMKHFLDRFN